MRQSTLDRTLEKVSAFLPTPANDGGLKDDQVLSLLFPTPHIETDTRKVDLIKKNLISALEEERRGPEKMRASLKSIVASLEVSDMPEGGFAVFTNGEETQFVELQQSPRPRLALSGSALALPVIADALEAGRFWVAVLDVERPVLYHVEEGVVHDKTPKDVTTLSETMGQYEPMASVSWHSSGSVRRTGAPAQFHALGTATEDLKKDEIERVLMAFAKQVEDIARGNDPLILAGGPSRIGHFREHIDMPNLLEDAIQAGGEALAEDEVLASAFEIAKHKRERDTHADLENTDTSGAVRDLDELVAAAHRGQVETFLIHPDHLGFVPGNDERLQLDDEPDPVFLKRCEAASYAIKNGAGLLITRQHTGDGPIGIKRFD